MRIRRSTLHHNDSLNDRSSGSNLETALLATCEAWQAVNQELYNDLVYAALYRGEQPPSDYFAANVSTTKLKSNVFSGDREEQRAEVCTYYFFHPVGFAALLLS